MFYCWSNSICDFQLTTVITKFCIKYYTLKNIKETYLTLLRNKHNKFYFIIKIKFKHMTI